MFNWICPSCQSLLKASDKSWQCSQGHNFDRAKSGYVNLLLANHKSSQSPGDSKDMLLARRDFLKAGFYQGVADEIAKLINSLAIEPDKNKKIHLLDCGCGEGYYLQQLSSRLFNDWQFAGVDISKTAVELAAKRRLKNSTWVCASNSRLPLQDDSVDIVLRVFSPPDDGEVKRVLRDKGFLIVVTPGDNHLIEIKSRLYAEVKPYAKTVVPDGFGLHSHQEFDYPIRLQSNTLVQHLLSMTPFIWNGDKQARDLLMQQDSLSTTVNMRVSCYQTSE